MLFKIFFISLVLNIHSFNAIKYAYILLNLFYLFIGRGPNTHAYMHSVQAGHHVFLNLQTLRFYCIPDNYEIIDSSLDDITVRILSLATF